MEFRGILPLLVLTLFPMMSWAADQRLSDLLLQIQRLQQEVQQLRGQVEVQRHELDTLKRQQRDQYVDLDSRLRAQSGASQPSAPGALPAEQRQPAMSAGTEAAGSSGPRIIGSGSVKPAGEKESYRAAFDLLKLRKYDDAVRAFEDLLARYPNGEFADNAHYWLGETHYVQRDFPSSLTQFQRVLANYPLSPKVPDSMLKIGYIHYERSDWQRARATLKDVIAKFPDTTEARLAQSRLDRMTRDGH
jgi:tol-pal system protein YbgF